MSRRRILAAWAKSEEPPKFVGVDIVGSSVQLKNGILSDFKVDSYALLPYTNLAGFWDESWEVAIRLFSPTRVFPGGVFNILGSGQLFSPIYIHTSYGVVSYLGGIGWPTLITNTTELFAKAVDIVIKISFDGIDKYKSEIYLDGAWITFATVTSPNKVISKGETSLLGCNRGTDSPINASIDLNYAYVKRGSILQWEGVLGAYSRVIRL